MWCRIILTAVAISYVICMLLLSGLQKEDLDAGTLEKLSRHNVNIDDMNNEERRQQCILDSYSLKGNDTENNATSVQVQTTQAYTITSKRAEKDVSVEKIPKTKARIEDNIVDRTLHNDPNINKTKGIFDLPNHKTTKISPIDIIPPINEVFINKKSDLGTFNNVANTKNVEENKGLQIDIQNQPDVESIINFWTKLTHHTKTVVTRLPTTPTMPTITEVKNVTTTVRILSPHQGNANTKNMEYISKLLADYLATQTTPTTTQQMTTEVHKNYLPIKYAEIANQYGISEELFRLFPTNTNEPISEKSEIIKRNKISQDDLHANGDMLSSISEETKSILFKYSKPQIKKTQDSPYSLILNEPKIKLLTPAKNSGPIKFLDGLLQVQNANRNEEPVSSTDTTAKINKIKRNKQENSETFDHYNLVQNMNAVNNTAHKLKQIQYLLNIDRSKSGSLEAETWEPVQYEPIHKKPKQKLHKVLNKDANQNLATYDNQFDAALTEIDNVKRLNTLRVNKYLDETVNKSGQTQNYDPRSIRVKVRPGHMKRPKLNKIFKGENDRFKTLLPSIKNAKLNSRTTNNLLKFSPEELNKSEQNDNGVFITLEAAKDNARQNHQFNEEPKTIRNMEPLHIELSNRNENTTPVVKDLEAIEEDTYQEIKTIPERYKFQQHKERRMPVNDLKPNQNFGSKLIEPGTIPANVLKEIAEKVKQIVLKDIEKDVTTVRLTPPLPTEMREAPTVTSTTLAPTTVISTTVAPTTTSTTIAPTTVTTPGTTTTIITTSAHCWAHRPMGTVPNKKINRYRMFPEKPSTLQKEITEANQVIKKLMEIFKELKAMKSDQMFTSQMLPNTTVSIPTTVHRTTKLPATPQTHPRDPFNPYIVKGATVKNMDVNPYMNGMMPVPQNQAPHYSPQFPVIQANDKHLGAITIQTNEDEIAPLAIQISQPLKAMNQHIIVTTKRTIDRMKQELERENKKRIDESILGPIKVRNHKEKYKVQSDFSKNVRFGESYKKHDFHDQYSYKTRFIKDREKPWRNHECNEKVRHYENHAMGSRFKDAINYPGGISNLENLDRQRGLSNSEGMSYTGGINRPGLNRYNEMPRIKQPVTFSQSDYDREPRYEGTKFHEKLEGIDNWPRNSWKEIKTLPTDTSYDEITARQQMPMVKVKQRTRFDDSHFTNFLKSQQKVTDMLEKILATNMKNNGPNSVEVP